ncbi:hypothetical protein MKK75_08640 [Methylobacterium sp. J-030]|uniref:hypothetical protein n=1 Tax=Methylobacterium sp. J-030 TaxID=2836627 RepID=UPI001FBA2C7F|nr:hypothetical protein [Methylobacterium sp. J-030]MCJ2068867.1 hypothetical protein [Methylobacterium sp. J-030]
MNDPIMNSVIHPSVRAGIEEMFRQDQRAAERREAEAAERRREEVERRERDAETMRRTLVVQI